MWTLVFNAFLLVIALFLVVVGLAAWSLIRDYNRRYDEQ